MGKIYVTENEKLRIGQRINERLTELNMMQVDLVVKIGFNEKGRYIINQQQLSNWITGKTHPSFQSLELLARNLNVDLNYFSEQPFNEVDV